MYTSDKIQKVSLITYVTHVCKVADIDLLLLTIFMWGQGHKDKLKKLKSSL
jgi:hypothetical protein